MKVSCFVVDDETVMITKSNYTKYVNKQVYKCKIAI